MYTVVFQRKNEYRRFLGILKITQFGFDIEKNPQLFGITKSRHNRTPDVKGEESTANLTILPTNTE